MILIDLRIVPNVYCHASTVIELLFFEICVIILSPNLITAQFRLSVIHF
jgi:hypothetical protein